ncbi:Sorting nexin 9 variant [Fasciola gigantica]|uniref:Sorting nexin 9 variant n=1 Tax=Fasciola gigantica TaxID=46835 RepID=A0A504Z232_FASGI|nr:Sorting nexin 9 variant [Fasciola gigantica]
MRARVIYDFSAQAEGELSVAAGEEVTITDQSVGSGWWSARNDFGREGLIPSSFVEPLDIPEPNIPPPPPPQMTTYGDASAVQDWDDDWDSDESDHGSMVQPNATDRFLGPSTRKQSENTSCSSRTFGQVPGSGPTPIHTDSMRLVPLRKGFPRSFLRSGGDDFLLNNDPPTLPQTEAIIEFVNGIFVWRPLDTPIQCKISSFHKDSKMKGIKSFIAYQLNTSLTKAHVSRRYKHFDWLYCRLVAKYPCVRIPPLPEKAITGRYEDEFVDERRKLLQLWLDRMCKHPVVAQSHVFIHFLTCADVKVSFFLSD